MSLTEIIHCFEGPGDDVVHLARNPRHKQLVVACSQDNCLMVYDVFEYQTLARVDDFSDSVTCALWVSPTRFVVTSLDGTLRLYEYDPAALPVPIELSRLDELGPLAGLHVWRHFVYAYAETGELHVVSYKNPTAPDLCYAAFCDGLREV